MQRGEGEERAGARPTDSGVDGPGRAGGLGRRGPEVPAAGRGCCAIRKSFTTVNDLGRGGGGGGHGALPGVVGGPGSPPELALPPRPPGGPLPPPARAPPRDRSRGPRATRVEARREGAGGVRGGDAGRSPGVRASTDRGARGGRGGGRALGAGRGWLAGRVGAPVLRPAGKTSVTQALARPSPAGGTGGRWEPGGAPIGALLATPGGARDPAPRRTLQDTFRQRASLIRCVVGV